MKLPIERSGHKLQRIQSEITVDGEQIVFIFEMVDPATGEDAGKVRFFCDYEMLGGVISKFLADANVVKTLLEKTGNLRPDKTGGGKFDMLKIERAGAATIVDEPHVGMEIRASDGPLYRFWMTSHLAKGLGQQLISAAKQQEGKLGRH